MKKYERAMKEKMLLKLEKERLIRKVNQRREGLLSGIRRTKLVKKRKWMD